MIDKIPCKKLGMTSVFGSEEGEMYAVTLLEPYTLVVTQIKTIEKDGYSALQLAYDPTLTKRINKPMLGKLKKAGVETNKLAYRHLYEVKIPETDVTNYQLGQVIDPAEFVGSWGTIEVFGISKGKGFQGAIKRWNQTRQSMSHGTSKVHRKPGSAGATDAARVFKGNHKPGRMGNERVTVRNLKVHEYNSKHKLLAIVGSVPSAKGNCIYVTYKTSRTEGGEE